ncbi:hypothetical protein BU15DRAFT_68278 [Melanogaster broomeanus]|nr:hypothetical protein BU15DRAFT_68278 [Melanogaster broomeanus]
MNKYHPSFHEGHLGSGCNLPIWSLGMGRCTKQDLVGTPRPPSHNPRIPAASVHSSSHPYPCIWEVLDVAVASDNGVKWGPNPESLLLVPSCGSTQRKQNDIGGNLNELPENDIVKIAVSDMSVASAASRGGTGTATGRPGPAKTPPWSPRVQPDAVEPTNAMSYYNVSQLRGTVQVVQAVEECHEMSCSGVYEVRALLSVSRVQDAEHLQERRAMLGALLACSAGSRQLRYFEKAFDMSSMQLQDIVSMTPSTNMKSHLQQNCSSPESQECASSEPVWSATPEMYSTDHGKIDWWRSAFSLEDDKLLNQVIVKILGLANSKNHNKYFDDLQNTQTSIGHNGQLEEVDESTS